MILAFVVIFDPLPMMILVRSITTTSDPIHQDCTRITERKRFAKHGHRRSKVTYIPQAVGGTGPRNQVLMYPTLRHDIASPYSNLIQFIIYFIIPNVTTHFLFQHTLPTLPCPILPYSAQSYCFLSHHIRFHHTLQYLIVYPAVHNLTLFSLPNTPLPYLIPVTKSSYYQSIN